MLVGKAVDKSHSRSGPARALVSAQDIGRSSIPMGSRKLIFDLRLLRNLKEVGPRVIVPEPMHGRSNAAIKPFNEAGYEFPSRTAVPAPGMCSLKTKAVLCFFFGALLRDMTEVL